MTRYRLVACSDGPLSEGDIQAAVLGLNQYCVGYPPNEVTAAALEAALKGADNKLSTSQRLTGLQVQHIWDFIDGDLETEVRIAHYDAGKDEDTDEVMPAGLYVWLEDYPDEGRMWLPETAAEANAADGVADAGISSAKGEV